MDSSTARLPSRLATAVEGAAAPIAKFIEAPTCRDRMHLGFTSFSQPVVDADHQLQMVKVVDADHEVQRMRAREQMKLRDCAHATMLCKNLRILLASQQTLLG